MPNPSSIHSEIGYDSPDLGRLFLMQLSVTRMSSIRTISQLVTTHYRGTFQKPRTLFSCWTTCLCMSPIHEGLRDPQTALFVLSSAGVHRPANP